MKLALASTSPYRKALLEKIGLEFNCLAPEIDEEQLKNSLLQKNIPPTELAQILAHAKVHDVVLRSSAGEKTLIIGADQLVHVEGHIIGKPHDFNAALAQLKFLRNKTHELITAVCLVTNEDYSTHTHVTRLHMRDLDDYEIENYLKMDTPYDCAGSYKIEAGGIALFSSIAGDDFSAIQGLPMIWLCNKLKEYRYEFFRQKSN